MTQDDLTPWQDTPLVQALTAPSSTSELSGEGVALAAFQSASSAGRRGRSGVVRFLGTGMTSVALIGVVGGGVAAAAYTKSLPSPVQSFFHDVLGPIGVPAPAPAGHDAHGRHHVTAGKPAPKLTPVAAVPTPSPSAGATTPSPQPSRVSDGSKHHATRPGVSGPGASGTTPTPEPTQAKPSPSPSPTATGPAGDPSTWSMSASLSKHAVLVHHGVQVSGQLLDAAGQPVADHRVVVRVHVAGTTGWQRVAVRRTSSTGTVQAWLGSLSHDELVVLGAGNNVHSATQRVVVVPVLSVSVAQNAAGTGYVVTVAADGGDSGDLVNLLKHTPSGWQRIGQSHLDGTGQVSFAVPAPQRKHSYVVRLPATKRHGYSQKQFTLLPIA